MPGPKQLRMWAFTDFTNASVDFFSEFKDRLATQPNIQAGVVQLERAPDTGRLHFQGALFFAKKITMAGVKKILPTAHLTECNGSWEDQVKYCTKEDSRVECAGAPAEWGTGPTPGVRSDLAALRDYIKEFFADENYVMEDLPRLLAETFPKEYAMYPQGVRNLITALRPKFKFSWTFDDLRPHQMEFIQMLDGGDTVAGPYTNPSRQILWVRDVFGGSGKTVMCQYILAHYDAIVLSGKVADMAYSYSGQKVVLFDLSRTQGERAEHLYDFAEKLKGGFLYSPKYDGLQKTFCPPHVIFFSNAPYPDVNSEGRQVWSSDRKCEIDWDEYGQGAGTHLPDSVAPFRAVTGPLPEVFRRMSVVSPMPGAGAASAAAPTVGASAAPQGLKRPRLDVGVTRPASPWRPREDIYEDD